MLQDVFVGLPRALQAYEERGSFASWLLKVTARTALMRVRTRARHRTEPLSFGTDVVAALDGRGGPPRGRSGPRRPRS